MVEPFVMHYNASPVIRSLAHRPNCRVCAGSARPDRRSVDLWRRAQFNCNSVPHRELVHRRLLGQFKGARRGCCFRCFSGRWRSSPARWWPITCFTTSFFFSPRTRRTPAGIGHVLNEFEQRQLVEWVPKTDDFLKHDDENRTYDDVFGALSRRVRQLQHLRLSAVGVHTPTNPTSPCSRRRMGCACWSSGADRARRLITLPASARSRSHALPIPPCKREICRRKFEKFGGRVSVIVTDFDRLDLPDNGCDTIYAFKSIGYSKDIDAWLARCWRMLKPGGRVLIRSPGSLDHCRREQDFRSVTGLLRELALP